MGFLITIEGGEFTGKTTVAVPGLAAVLEQAGIPSLVSREPGGTERGEDIRARIFQRKDEGASAHELAELFNEARQIHLEDVVHPFLQEHPHGIALLDRYADSTVVYQGLEPENPLPLDDLLAMHETYTGGVHPDLTLLLHIPEAVYAHTHAQRSAQERDELTAWDRASVAEHIRRQQLYMSLPDIFAERNIDRSFAVVDASVRASDVVRALAEHVERFLHERDISIEFRQSFDELTSEGYWAEIDGKWIPPHEGYEVGLPVRARA